ncbi:MAG: hypothetical protein K8R40_05515 [Anaerolineaceae bacterium]|nr:hypothetical protein [Anaerolineaceae bacterium]
MMKIKFAPISSVVILLLMITGCNYFVESSNECNTPENNLQNISTYLHDDFVQDFFQFDSEYINTFIYMGLAEEEMNEYFEITGRHKVIMGVEVQKGGRVIFPDDFGVRYYLFSYPIKGRCDFYEIYPSIVYETIRDSQTIRVDGEIQDDQITITGGEYVYYFNINTPIPKDTAATHLRVVIKGALQGQSTFDAKPVGAYYDVPIEIFSINE